MDEMLSKIYMLQQKLNTIGINGIGIIIKVFYIVVILLLARLSFAVVQKAVKAYIHRRSDKETGRMSAREETLLPLVISIMRYVIYFIALLIVLKELGVDTSAILASAGVLGLAIGFGAQNLVRDFISGLFIYFDGLIKVGDVITVNEVTGSVEKIDLRNTMVREFNGKLWSVPNGDIRSLGNLNRDWNRAIVEVGVAYEQEVSRAFQALQEIGEAWANDFSDVWLEKPEVQGVLGLGDSSVNLRMIVKIKPLMLWETERELRRRIKDAFDEKGIEIPFPRHVVYNRTEN